MTKYVGAFNNDEGSLVSPDIGAEVNVSAEMGKALIASESAEEVKTRKASKARTGPEETRG